jgi:hypothetical protein
MPPDRERYIVKNAAYFRTARQATTVRSPTSGSRSTVALRTARKTDEGVVSHVPVVGGTDRPR